MIRASWTDPTEREDGTAIDPSEILHVIVEHRPPSAEQTSAGFSLSQQVSAGVQTALISTAEEGWHTVRVRVVMTDGMESVNRSQQILVGSSEEPVVLSRPNPVEGLTLTWE